MDFDILRFLENTFHIFFWKFRPFLTPRNIQAQWKLNPKVTPPQKSPLLVHFDLEESVSPFENMFKLFFVPEAEQEPICLVHTRGNRQKRIAKKSSNFFICDNSIISQAWEQLHCKDVGNGKNPSTRDNHRHISDQ